MKKYNVVLILNTHFDKVLMCKRSKEPYKGLLNLVGGLIEDDSSINEAYRELEEETGINKQDIELHHLMDFTYHTYDIKLEVFMGKVDDSIKLVEEANELLWIDLSENFFDTKRFAGEGNIGHMLMHALYNKSLLED